MVDAATFSDFIVFVDESGDHSLEVINPDYPVFVLAFCILPGTGPATRRSGSTWVGPESRRAPR